MKYEKMIRTLIQYDIIQEEDGELYSYGLHHAILYASNFLMAFILAMIADGLPVFLLFLFVFIPLRSYVGGFHFNHATLCVITSQLTIFSVQLFVPVCSDHHKLLVILFIISYITTLLITLFKKKRSNDNRYTDSSLHQKYTKIAIRYEMCFLVLFICCVLLEFWTFATTICYAFVIEVIVSILPDIS